MWFSVEFQEPDQPIDFLSGLLTEPADRADDIGRLCVGRDVQPIQAGYGVIADVFRGGVLCTPSAWVIGGRVITSPRLAFVLSQRYGQIK
jgi:hypothetical protein